MNKTVLLYLTIVIEGYVVLATELIVIRQLIPVVGSGPEIISIIISAVLLPLAAGYYKGGQSYERKYAKAVAFGKQPSTVRAILLLNILAAVMFLAIGLSYEVLNIFFYLLVSVGVKQRLLQTLVYCVLFLVTPIFLLGQTLPLVSNYFSSKKLSEITGKMLFFSTTGSFLGSVFSTIVLMSVIGVHNTVTFTLGLLCLLGILLEKRKSYMARMSWLIILGVVAVLNNGTMMRRLTHIVSDNAYNVIMVVPHKDWTTMSVGVGGGNSGVSAILAKDPDNGIPVITYIETTFIDPLTTPATNGNGNDAKGPADILIIGAGGFILGLDDTYNHYTYVDIDPDIKNVAETEFLQRKLTSNKQFSAISARAFVHTNTHRYNLVVIDTYTNTYSVAMETTTQEFLREAKQALKPNGILLANVYSSPNYQDLFSIRYNNTFASVFPGYVRQTIGKFDPWKLGVGSQYASVLYVYFDVPNASDKNLYSDDKDTYSFDLGH